jgi:Tfp pilus assembly PilM family ATPase
VPRGFAVYTQASAKNTAMTEITLRGEGATSRRVRKILTARLKNKVILCHEIKVMSMRLNQNIYRRINTAAKGK